MTPRLSPRSEAIAFRIWAYCEPKEWDVTFNEIADALEINAQQVGSIMRWKGWLDRIRPASRAGSNLARIDGSGHNFMAKFDDWLDL